MWMLWDIRFHQPLGFLPQKCWKIPQEKPTALEVNRVASGVLVAASRQSMLQSYLRFSGLDFRQVPKASCNPT